MNATFYTRPSTRMKTCMWMCLFLITWKWLFKRGKSKLTASMCVLHRKYEGSSFYPFFSGFFPFSLLASTSWHSKGWKRKKVSKWVSERERADWLTEESTGRVESMESTVLSDPDGGWNAWKESCQKNLVYLRKKYQKKLVKKIQECPYVKLFAINL